MASRRVQKTVLKNGRTELHLGRTPGAKGLVRVSYPDTWTVYFEFYPSNEGGCNVINMYESEEYDKAKAVYDRLKRFSEPVRQHMRGFI